MLKMSFLFIKINYFRLQNTDIYYFENKYYSLFAAEMYLSIQLFVAVVSAIGASTFLCSLFVSWKLNSVGKL